MQLTQIGLSLLLNINLILPLLKLLLFSLDSLLVLLISFKLLPLPQLILLFLLPQSLLLLSASLLPLQSLPLFIQHSFSLIFYPKSEQSLGTESPPKHVWSKRVPVRPDRQFSCYLSPWILHRKRLSKPVRQKWPKNPQTLYF